MTALSSKKPYFALVTVFLIWGSLYVVSKYALNVLPAFTVIFLRSVIASVTLLTYLRVRKLTRPVARSDYKYFLLAGIGGYFLSVGFQTIGTKFASPAMASLLNSLNPLSIGLVSWLILKERPTVRKFIGIGIAICGVYLVLGGIGGNNELIGVLCSLSSVVIWSFVSAFNKQLTRRYNSLQITAYGVTIATVCNLIPAAVEWRSHPVGMTLPAAAAILYMGIFCTGVAHFLWNWCLARMEASTCSAFYPLQPITSALLGIIFLKEHFTLSFAIGSALTLIGVVVGVREPRKKAAASK